MTVKNIQARGVIAEREGDLITALECYKKIDKNLATVNPALFTKSGLMVGLGESRQEITQVMDDLRTTGVDFLTIGQYLQPTVKNVAVDRYVTPAEFIEYAALARAKGFLMVAASPLTRSSYHAEE